MTKIDLITGILGSGKTTFLVGYARHMINNGERIAILENDFGAVNVDMLMLKALKGDNCQLEMISGERESEIFSRSMIPSIRSISTSIEAAVRFL